MSFLTRFLVYETIEEQDTELFMNSETGHEQKICFCSVKRIAFVFSLFRHPLLGYELLELRSFRNNLSTFLPPQGRSKVYLHSTLPITHHWDYTEYVIVVVYSDFHIRAQPLFYHVPLSSRVKLLHREIPSLHISGEQFIKHYKRDRMRMSSTKLNECISINQLPLNHNIVSVGCMTSLYPFHSINIHSIPVQLN